MYLLFELCPQPLTLFALSLSRDSDFPGYTHHHHADDLPSVMPTTPSAIAAPSFVSLTLEPSAPPLISFSFFWVLCSDMRPTAQPQQFHVTVNVVATVIVVVESKVQSTTVCCACECVCMVGVASFFNTIPHFSRFLGNAFSFIFSDLHHEKHHLPPPCSPPPSLSLDLLALSTSLTIFYFNFSCSEIV